MNSASIDDRQQPFRFVRHLPEARADAVTPTGRGQVSDKPRGRKPRRTGRCRLALWRLQAHGGAVKVRSIGAQPLSGEASAVIGVERRRRQACAQVGTCWNNAPNTSWPCRRLERRQSQFALATESSHDVDRRGGARIVSPRVKVCTMVIAWPQCGQTKVDRCVSTGSSSGRGSCGGTCISWRTSARLAVRLQLASSP